MLCKAFQKAKKRLKRGISRAKEAIRRVRKKDPVKKAVKKIIRKPVQKVKAFAKKRTKTLKRLVKETAKKERKRLAKGEQRFEVQVPFGGGKAKKGASAVIRRLKDADKLQAGFASVGKRIQEFNRQNPFKFNVAKAKAGAKELKAKLKADIRTFQTAKEYIEAAPDVAAKILAGAARKSVPAKGFRSLGQKAVTKTGKQAFVNVQFPPNTKSAKLTQGILSKIAASKGWTVFKLSAIGTIIGTYPWSEWALGEAREGMNFNTEKALRTEDPEIINEFLATAREIYDTSTFELIQRLIPFVNIRFSFGEKTQALIAQWKVNDKLAEDALVSIENPEETFEDRVTRMREEETEQDQAAVDFYNEERKKMVLWEQAASRSVREERTAEGKRAREAEARFWRKERAKQREKEAEDRKAIADFWIAYRKTLLKIQEDNRPSNLNFGLL